MAAVRSNVVEPDMFRLRLLQEGEGTAALAPSVSHASLTRIADRAASRASLASTGTGTFGGHSYYSSTYRYAAAAGVVTPHEHPVPDGDTTWRHVRAISDVVVFLKPASEEAAAGPNWQSIISRHEFNAICEFQTRHPELYPPALLRYVPLRASTELRAAMQVHAYHACQAGPHAAEFRRIVKEARKEVRAGALGRGASSHGSVSYAQCLRGRYVRTCGLSANEQKELRKQLDPIVLPKRDLNGLNGAVVVWDAAANEWGVDVPALGFGATLLPVKPDRLEWLRG